MQRGGASLANFQISRGRFHHVATWSLFIGVIGGHGVITCLIVVINCFQVLVWCQCWWHGGGACDLVREKVGIYSDECAALKRMNLLQSMHAQFQFANFKHLFLHSKLTASLSWTNHSIWWTLGLGLSGADDPMVQGSQESLADLSTIKNLLFLDSRRVHSEQCPVAQVQINYLIIASLQTGVCVLSDKTDYHDWIN